MIRALAFALFCLPAAAFSLTIETAFTRAYTKDALQTLGQQAGVATGDGFRTVVRSQAESFDGHFFILKLSDLRSGRPIQARIEIIASDSKEARVVTWDLQNEKLKRWTYLGLTGSDWPVADPAVRPMAWRIQFLGTEEQILAEWKSFLWELP